MNRVLLFLASLLVFVLPHASAQDNRASAKAYARGEGDDVQLAIEIKIQAGWHLYQGPTKEDMGPADAVGLPTTVELAGDGFTWSAVRYPTPVRAPQEIGDTKTWINELKGTITLYVRGKKATGADLTQLKLNLEGLTCQDNGVCIPYSESIEVKGKGSDALFAKFPADLVVATAKVPAPAESPATPPAVQPVVPPPVEPAAAPILAPKDVRSSAPGNTDSKAKASVYARSTGDDVQLAIVIAIQPGWHVYHGPTAEDMGPPEATGTPTTVELTGEGFRWSVARFPTPEKAAQAFGATKTWIYEHSGTLTLFVRGKKTSVADLAKLTIDIEGQTCQDGGTCRPYAESLHVIDKGSDALFAKFPTDLVVANFTTPTPNTASGTNGGATNPPVPTKAVDPKPTSATNTAGTASTTTPATTSTSGGVAPNEFSLLAFLLSAIGWGLFTLLMPCTYPMIPITISYFTKQAAKREGSALPLSITYGLGIIAIFVLIGVLVGPVITAFASHPVTNLIIGVAFLYFSLTLFGVLDLQPPAFLLSAAGKASTKGGHVGVFLMGATLVITSFTCTAPFVGSLLSAGASSGSLGRVALGMAVFGATMAIPFTLLSMLPAKAKSMPRSGEWMHTLKVTLGFVEVAAALKFISNVDLAWGWEWLSRELFLFLWVAIFAAAALYLFGMIRLNGEQGNSISPVRMLAGLMFLLLSLYSGYGALGNRMDSIMTAIIPPYSNHTGSFGGTARAGASERVMVIDDYDAALKRARDENKLLLVNLTGHV